MDPQDADKWKVEHDKHKDNFKAAGSDGSELFNSIRHGDRVTILTPQNQQISGKAVMKGPHGWVINLGGPHGRPGIASPENIVRVKKSASEEVAASPHELREMQDILKQHGYNPQDAKKLQAEGMGPSELEHRIKTTRPGGMGSLEYTHRLQKLAGYDYRRQ
jgi:hypothetical protein